MSCSPAALVALLAGWGLIQSTRSTLFEGVEVRDEGGFVVIILVETMVFLTDLAVAVA